jgi:hypothetical protein
VITSAPRGPAMLYAMDIQAATAGSATAPWLLFGAVLALLLVLLAGLTAALVRRRTHRPAPAGGGDSRDDLPGFLEFPPGSAAAGDPAGWAALAVPPAVEDPPPARRQRRDTRVVLTAMAATAVLLIGVLAAVAVASRSDGPGDRDRAAAADARTTTARLTFGGVVLEPRAVGVTATYPVVEFVADGDRWRARIEFPMFNCLTADAPADPVAAGCLPTLSEYAELSSPDLAVDHHGDGLVITGRFPTETRPNGSPPSPTGKTYELRITVTPAGPPTEDGWQPAEGVLELGPGRAVTVDEPGVSVMRSGS